MSKKQEPVATDERSSHSERSEQLRKGAAAPRDLKTEDAGVPRADWGNAPSPRDDADKDGRAALDDEESPYSEPDANPTKSETADD